MATRPSDIPNINNQLSELQRQQDEAENKLTNSPTAFSSATPTRADISGQESYQRISGEIRRLTDEKKKAQWYPPEKQKSPAVAGGEQNDKQGFIGKGLDFLTRPLYGVVGATKHAIGQGSGSLQQDVADNIKRNKSLFGDVLKTSGMPTAVSSPLGFALDVALDPVNWLTAGTGSTVGRAFIGAKRGFQGGEGVMTGVKSALKSSALETATTVGRYTPYVKNSSYFAKLGENSVAATDAFEALTKSTAQDMAVQGTFRRSLGEAVTKMIEKNPSVKALAQHFIYDPVDWVRQTRIKDVFENNLKTGNRTGDIVKEFQAGNDITPMLYDAQMAEKIKNTPSALSEKIVPFEQGKPGEVKIDFDQASKMQTPEEVDKFISDVESMAGGNVIKEKIYTEAVALVKGVDDVASMDKDPGLYRTADPLESANRIMSDKQMEEALAATNAHLGGGISFDDIHKLYTSGALDQTGVKWYDNMVKGTSEYIAKLDKAGNVKLAKTAQGAIDNYDRSMAIFRVAKVAASPTSWMNAVAGNMIMAHMAGFGMSPRYMSRLSDMGQMYSGKAEKRALLDSLLMDADKSGDSIRKGLYENKTAARGTFGDIDMITNPFDEVGDMSKATTERFMTYGRDAGIIPQGMTAEDLGPELKAQLDELKKKYQEIVNRPTSGFDITKKAIKAAGGDVSKVTRLEIGTGMESQELFNSRVSAELFEFIEKKAKEATGISGTGWKTMNFMFNKMPSGYEKIDQSYKMATFVYSTVDGFTKDEYMRILKLIKINPEEIRTVVSEGQKRYRISARSAIELSNVMFLNYAAMPSAVRVLRNLKFVGSPFIAFMYGMTLKTGQTLVDNPEAFNKVSYALSEFGGDKTPLEKKALDDPKGFYSYLKADGMYRLPTKFFDENPMYMNLANVIPYYSLNMFNPSKSQYTDDIRGTIAEKLQNSPFMKDPYGSVLFDFLILPMILDDATKPQGQFGQPLYPVDAGAATKLGYGARTLGEAFVPNILNYTGLLGGAVMPEWAIEASPLYRFRKIARSMNGENQLGISVKEDPTKRTVRELLNATGIPLQTPVDTTFQQGG